ncbi:hypothetical protein B0H19DRAFT_1060280 [Mycena capillaripes]|nr:hypothetical protein B0H19DRAFT_1060280 [Mycena capillaripes]
MRSFRGRTSSRTTSLFPPMDLRMRFDVWNDAASVLEKAPDPDVPNSRAILATLSAQDFRKLLGFLKDGEFNEELDRHFMRLALVGAEDNEHVNGMSLSTMECVDDSPPLTRLPAELGLQILGDLTLADSIRYAQVSKDSAAIVALHLQTAATDLLCGFDLRFGEVRLMQIAMDSIIAGSTVASLMVGAEKFRPNDIYAPVKYGYYFVRFLRMGGRYTVEKTDSRTSDDNGCMFSAFPSWDFDHDVEPSPMACWTLGGTGVLLVYLLVPRPSSLEQPHTTTTFCRKYKAVDLRDCRAPSGEGRQRAPVTSVSLYPFRGWVVCQDRARFEEWDGGWERLVIRRSKVVGRSRPPPVKGVKGRQ